MLIGYARISKSNGSQVLDLQTDALLTAGVKHSSIFTDTASGAKERRPGLDNCLNALRSGDTLIVWKLDRLGRNLRHLINIVQSLSDKGVGFKVLTGQGAQIDTTTANGRLIFNIFAALSEFELELIRERTIAGLESARRRGRNGGRPFTLTGNQIELIQAAMRDYRTSVSDLCRQFNISRATLYNYVGPKGELRERGKMVLNAELSGKKTR